MYRAIQREPAFLRRRQVDARYVASRSTICPFVRNGAVPKPVAFGRRAVGWLESDIGDWIAEPRKVTPDGSR